MILVVLTLMYVVTTNRQLLSMENQLDVMDSSIKLQVQPLPVPAIKKIYLEKITSKADNTMGIMVSISGYSSVAKNEASGDRTPLLLLDHSHLYLVLGGIMGFADVVDRIRRHASQTSEAYLAADKFTA